VKPILAVFVLLFASVAARADSIITITATDVTIGAVTLDMSTSFDTTIGQLVSNSTSIGFLGNQAFGAGFSFFFVSPDGTLFDWTDAAGDFLQFDPHNEEGENANLFPQIGDYPVWIVDVDCRSAACEEVVGLGFNGESGTLVVTDPIATTPEPGVLVLLALGVMGLVALKLKTSQVN